MAGRKMKPTPLKVIEGTFRKDRANDREPVPDGNLSTAPEHFSDEQRAVWDYAITHAPKGLLKNLDLSVLEVWVTAYVFYREAVKKIPIAGQVIKTPSGYPVTNPYMANMNRQVQNMMKAAAEMGFTPASRSRIVVAEESSKDDPWARLIAKG